MKFIHSLVKADKAQKTWKEDFLAPFVVLLVALRLPIGIGDLSFIDHACLDLFVNWDEQHKTQGGELDFDWETLHSVFQRHA